MFYFSYIYNHKANADRRKILSTRVLPNCIELLLVGIELQFAASKTPAHSTEPIYIYIYIYVKWLFKYTLDANAAGIQEYSIL